MMPKPFDADYQLLEEMYLDEYYPTFLVDKVKAELEKVITFLETGEKNIDRIQACLDEATCAINDLQEAFYDNDSEIETMARDSIATSVEAILAWFEIDLDLEEALRERDW